jgi:chaperone required for assembly of F1-ATPase
MKRFYKTATTGELNGAYTVLLDERPIKTPAKAELLLPTVKLASAIAEEWASQEDTVKPFTMPSMRYAATAIDRVVPQRNAVIEEISGFGDTDLVCYRASYPSTLVDIQNDAWNPIVEWIAKTHDVQLKVTEGVGYVQQEATALERMKSVIQAQSDLQLAAIHDVVNLTGSLVITLAVVAREVDAEKAFDISEIDETHVIEQWGEDAEQTKRRNNNKDSLVAAVKFLELCDP